MLTRVAAAMTMASAAVAVSGTTAAGAQATAPTTTTVATSTTTATSSTTVATSTTTATTVHASILRAAGVANPGAYYGNPKLGVQIAPGEPGLYPVFGADNQPDLSGFSIDATPAAGQVPPPGTTEPQPTCTPDTELSANTQPNVYCQTDTDGGFEFPMGSPQETYDFAVSASPQGFVHDPNQTVPIATLISGCPPDNLQGADDCSVASELGGPVTSADVTWFNYIGIYRELKVTVTGAGGATLAGVAVTLTCTAPAGAPADACPPAGEKNNLSTSPLATGPPFTVTTGSDGSAAFPGIYLPGATVHLVATPPAGYQGASTTVTVPSPVTGSGQTSLQISAAAQTPVPLALVLTKTPPPTTTTTTTATTTTTVPATTTTSTTAPKVARSSQLPLTGTDPVRSMEGGAVLLTVGAGLVVASRRRARKGRHFRRR